MSDYRESVQDYIRACEALLKLGDLSENEIGAVGAIRSRLSEQLTDRDNDPSE